MKNLEIEFKTLLPETDFFRILTHFQIKETDFVTQTNYYFETHDFLLKKQNLGLRIRKLSYKFELTLKIPQQIGILEITDLLTKDEAEKMIQGKIPIIKKEVFKNLLALHIDPKLLTVFGSLTTRRAEKKIPEGLLALDESWYNGQHDFELELEVFDETAGKIAFDQLLTKLNVSAIQTPNKVQRMFASSI